MPEASVDIQFEVPDNTLTAPDGSIMIVPDLDPRDPRRLSEEQLALALEGGKEKTEKKVVPSETEDEEEYDPDDPFAVLPDAVEKKEGEEEVVEEDKTEKKEEEEEDLDKKKDPYARNHRKALREARAQKRAVEAEKNEVATQLAAVKAELEAIRAGQTTPAAQAEQLPEFKSRVELKEFVVKNDPVLRQLAQQLQSIEASVEDDTKFPTVAAYIAARDRAKDAYQERLQDSMEYVHEQTTTAKTQKEELARKTEQAQQAELTKKLETYRETIKSSTIPNAIVYAQNVDTLGQQGYIHEGFQDTILTDEDADVLVAAIAKDKDTRKFLIDTSLAFNGKALPPQMLSRLTKLALKWEAGLPEAPDPERRQRSAPAANTRTPAPAKAEKPFQRPRGGGSGGGSNSGPTDPAEWARGVREGKVADPLGLLGGKRR
jgi:hypothetical protein